MRCVAKVLSVVSCFVVIGLFSGCATQAPAPTHQSSAIEKTSPAPKAEQPIPPKPTEPVVVEQPQPVPSTAPVENKPQNLAVNSLVQQAKAQYAAKNYAGAIATAERGLRIDRRAAELYLVLAQSYLQQANLQVAQQFVQQGIRYSQAGSEVAQSLLALRDQLLR